MKRVHLVHNPDGDVVTIIEASEDAGFYTWLHVAMPDLELSQPYEVETQNDFMADIIERQLSEVLPDDSV